MIKKALIILRVSSEMQEERNSLESQEDQAKNFAKEKGYVVYKIIKEVESGLYNNRAGYNELLEEIKLRSFDVLIAYELSRISRTQLEIHTTIKKLKENKIEWHFIMQPQLDSSSDLSDFLLGLYGGMAAQESKQLSIRLKARFKYYASQGYCLTSPPFGYDLKDKILYKNDKSYIVEDIFKSYINGVNKNTLAKKYGKNISRISEILENITYAGYIKYGRYTQDKSTMKMYKNEEYEIYKGLHEPIISLEDFNLVQKILKDKKMRHIKGSEDTRFLFSSLLVCSVCNRKLVGVEQEWKSKSGSRKYRAYKCASLKTHFRQCKSETLDNAILEQIKEYAKNNFEFLNINSQKKKKDYSKEIKRLEEKKKRIAETYTDGFINRDEYRKKIFNIDSELRELYNLNKEEISEATVNLKKKFIEYMDSFDEKDRLQQKKILQLIVDKVVYYPDETFEIFLNV